MKRFKPGWLRVIFLLATIFLLASCGGEDPIGPDPNDPGDGGTKPPEVTAKIPEVGLDVIISSAETTAELRGWSILGASDTEVNFEYKLDGAATWTKVKAVMANDSSGGKNPSPTKVMELRTRVNNLAPKSRYIYRVVAKNKAGEATSLEKILSTDVVRDYNGNVYPVIKIGNQYWLQRNLTATHYADGTPLIRISVTPNSPSMNEWGKRNPCVVYYEGEEKYYNTYGALYNSPSVKGEFIKGFRSPSVEDFSELISYLGGGEKAGIALADASRMYWDNNMKNFYSNSSGFTALPSGQKNAEGFVFRTLGQDCTLWTSDMTSPENSLPYEAMIFEIIDDGARIGEIQYYLYWGFAIRLIKND